MEKVEILALVAKEGPYDTGEKVRGEGACWTPGDASRRRREHQSPEVQQRGRRPEWLEKTEPGEVTGDEVGDITGSRCAWLSRLLLRRTWKTLKGL
jgi:hypothetical protein